MKAFWAIMSKWGLEKRYAVASCIIVILCFICLPKQGYSNNYVDLRKNMTPVKSQGQRNTCSVFSATAIMEYLFKINSKRELDLSEAYNYWVAKKLTLKTPLLKKVYSQKDALLGFLAVEAYRYGSMLAADRLYEMKNWEQL
jgi:hypothetical protein